MLESYKCIGTVGRMYCDNPPQRFVDSLVEMMQFSHIVDCKPGEYIDYSKGMASYHVLGRNVLAREMRGDWLLQLDTDHQFAADMLHRLLFLKTKYNLPVISVIYGYKMPPHGPVMGIWGENDRLLPVFDYPRDTDIIAVGAVGGGGLLVDKEVYQKIYETGEEPFDCIGGLSEDYSFCLRCKRLGIPIHVAPNVQSHHLVPHAISMNDYRPDHSNLQLAATDSGQIITSPTNAVK